MVVLVSCGCVSVLLRPVLHAYFFRLLEVPPSSKVLGGLVVYVYCCYVCVLPGLFCRGLFLWYRLCVGAWEGGSGCDV